MRPHRQFPNFIVAANLMKISTLCGAFVLLQVIIGLWCIWCNARGISHDSAPSHLHQSISVTIGCNHIAIVNINKRARLNKAASERVKTKCFLRRCFICICSQIDKIFTCNIFIKIFWTKRKCCFKQNLTRGWLHATSLAWIFLFRRLLALHN